MKSLVAGLRPGWLRPLVVVTCLGIAACGPTPPAEGPGGSASDPASPDAARDEPLASLCPPDTALFAELAHVDDVLRDVSAVFAGHGELAGLLTPAALGGQIADAVGVSAKDAANAIAHTERVALAMRGAGADEARAVLLQVDDPSVMTPLLASKTLVADGKSALGHALYRLEGDAEDGPIVAWDASAGILTAGDRKLVTDIARREAGSESLASTEEFLRATTTLPADSWGRIYFNPTVLLTSEELDADVAKGLFSPPQPWAASIRGTADGVAVRVIGGFAGDWVPGKKALPVAAGRALADRLPKETVAYALFSTKTGLDGKTAAVQLERLLETFGVPPAREMFKALGIGELGDFLGGLGDQAAIAFVVPPGAALDSELNSAVAVFALQLRDEKLGETILARARELAKSEGRRVTGDAHHLEVAPHVASAPPVTLTLEKGLLVVAAGPKPTLVRVQAAIFRGDGTLADNEAHRRSWASAPDRAQLFGYNDTRRLFDALAKGDDSLGVPEDLLAADALPTTWAVVAETEGERIALTADTLNLIGPASAMAIYGVRRYIAAAKASEAKNSIGAMARGAVGAFEREVGPAGAHRLCRTSTMVPGQVPSGVKYQPAENDYEAGDDATGWRCLKFMISMPQYYQYSYRQGGPYKGPARGGPDPGPRGFEVSAEGDLDGDGKTSLFTLVGTIDAKGFVQVSPSMFISDEFE